MKTRGEIAKAIREIEKDDRRKIAGVTIFNNAPLSLIQVEIDAKLRALIWVLSETEEKLY